MDEVALYGLRELAKELTLGTKLEKVTSHVRSLRKQLSSTRLWSSILVKFKLFY